jgi:hypothetical protein
MSSSLYDNLVAALPHVETTLNYSIDTGQKPVSYVCEPPPGIPRRTGKTGKQTIPIYDGRAVADQLTLDNQGFQLTRHDTKVVNFYDVEEVRRVYYPEVEHFLTDFFGADKVVVFDHNVRCAPMSQRGDTGVQEPARIAHNDYTLGSGPQRVRDLLGPQEAEQRLKHRVMQINLWRPIRGPVRDAPLAVCDAQSMQTEDFLACDLKFEDRTGEIYMIAHRPTHRWFYFPNMQRHEALLLKGYDSMDDGRARFTGHTGFDDPRTLPDAPPRESIETRTFIFFGPEAAL